MTWRIDRVVDSNNVVALCISGRITKQEVDALRDLIEGEASAVVVDLKNIVLVDGDAVKFLAQTERNGIALRNCPAYIREWVARERAETTETSGDVEDA
jgi:deoxyxylulose-5-phosphate synthase